MLNPLILIAAEYSLTIPIKSYRENVNGKKFDREMLIRTLPTSLP